MPQSPSSSPSPSPHFGPFFPSPLQLAIHHAERIALELAALERQRLGAPLLARWGEPGEPSEDEVWLVGRAEEVRAFVADLVEDWRRGALTTEEAALALDAHLAELHAGMKRHLWISAPPCCGDGAETIDARARPAGGAALVTPATASIAAVVVREK